MRNRTYGGVRGRKTKVGRKLLRFPPTRLFPIILSFANLFLAAKMQKCFIYEEFGYFEIHARLTLCHDEHSGKCRHH